MQTTWDAYFDLEAQIRDCALQAGLSKSRATAVAREIACRRPRGLLSRIDPRLLLQWGTPGADHPLVVRAHRVVAQYAPGLLPPLDQIRLRDLGDHLAGSTARGVIFINTHSPMIDAACAGNPLPLAAVLLHEQFHVQHPKLPEICAHNVEMRFLEKHS